MGLGQRREGEVEIHEGEKLASRKRQAGGRHQSELQPSETSLISSHSQLKWFEVPN